MTSTHTLNEEASLAQLLIPAELAHDTVDALGEVGQLQFKDLNTSKSAFQRTYANQVRYHSRRRQSQLVTYVAMLCSSTVYCIAACSRFP